MTEWVSQSQAVKLLADAGDKVSQPALSQYLAGHKEIPTQAGGPGKPTMIDWEALKRSRATRAGRGPSSTPLLDQAEPAPPAAEPSSRSPMRTDLSDRKAKADVERAEFDARRARIQAEEAEGRLIKIEIATGAFMAAGTALTRAMEEGRRTVVNEIRAAKDQRDAATAQRAYETKVRAAFAAALAEFAAAAQAADAPADPDAQPGLPPELAAAE